MPALCQANEVLIRNLETNERKCWPIDSDIPGGWIVVYDVTVVSFESWKVWLILIAIIVLARTMRAK